MNADVVVDVGNTRIKWGLYERGAVCATASLPPAPPAWERQLEVWRLAPTKNWAVAGVHPARRDVLVAWLRERVAHVLVIENYKQLPLEVRVSRPEKVGLDRLLNAVAATRQGERRRLPAVVVDAGSAVTVDWVDEEGVFRGGAIFPGLQLMAQALHDYTAALPLVAITSVPPSTPGLSTRPAIELGIYHAVVGGINTLIGLLASRSTQAPHIYLTGGDGRVLSTFVDDRAEYWPEMTLEGIRHSAEAQP